jgi:XTP/dITP diphosphohydrolase
MATVVVATGNPGKVKEMNAYLVDVGWDLVAKPKDLEVEETGATFLENARLKATTVAIATGQWAIADDSGLAVDALNGAPGLYSARYGKSDGDRIQRLLRELAETDQRSAQFICALVLARPDGTVALATEGICPGEITRTPQGSGGFGYDPVFYLPQLGKTFAELTPEEKHRHSHRGIAFAQLLPTIQDLAL